ncbi:alpha/beta fold hydrolase [Flocculibacter collagenilyticus]|uniref:alpha/beta fold hydrolase n=1 Tax=Flocculibacter collagenilyticus TaxID=2744479 RepID=UPI0018F6785D|nr:alpha/beta hydrolase [Flocculibacter collagenilyticus]
MKEVFYQLTHRKIAAIVSGSPDKPVLLALHGWLDNAGSFAFIQNKFPDHFFVAIDLPGHGHSDHKSADAHYHFLDWAEDIYQLIQHNNWQNITLIGHSMGGMISTVLAASFPELFIKLCNIEAVGVLVTQQSKVPEQVRKAILSRQKQISRQKVTYPSVQAAIKARVLHGDISAQSVENIVVRGLLQINTGYTWRADNRLRSESIIRLTEQQAVTLVEEIQCPVLIIKGSNGYKMVEQGIEHFGKHYKYMTCEVVDGGHHCHLDSPEQTAKVILEFVNK